VASPRINQLFIEIFSLVHSFIPRLIVFSGVKLDSAVCCRHQMENALVSAVSELDRRPASLIKQSLPHIRVRVRHAIHDASIAQDDDLLFAAECCFKEGIFECHLHLHDINLEFDLVTECHLARLDECSTLVEHCCRLRHNKNTVARLLQAQEKRVHCSCLTGTGATR